MQITSSAYFGVETLVRLAGSNAARPCTAEELAHAINRSTSYMEGLMSRLRDAGFVTGRNREIDSLHRHAWRLRPPCRTRCKECRSANR